MLTVGIVRFSFFGRSDTRLSHGVETDREMYFSELYDPQRMKQRFHFFEKLCLPSIANQSDKGFVTIILTSQVMPKVYRDRLNSLVEGLEGIEVVYARGANIHAELRQVIRKLMVDRCEPWIGFRIDDDDALGRTFVENLKEMSVGVSTKTIFSLSRGAHLFSANGRSYLTPRNKPFHSVGWAIFQKADDMRTPFKYGHTSAAKRFPSIVNSAPLSYVYCLHSFGDSIDRKTGRLQKMQARFDVLVSTAQFDAFCAEIEEAFPSIGYQGLLDAISHEPSSTTKPF